VHFTVRAVQLAGQASSTQCLAYFGAVLHLLTATEQTPSNSSLAWLSPVYKEVQLAMEVGVEAPVLPALAPAAGPEEAMPSPQPSAPFLSAERAAGLPRCGWALLHGRGCKDGTATRGSAAAW